MRFSTIFAAGLVAFASAQDTTNSATSTTSVAETTTYSISPEQSSITACLEACDAGDVDCEALCVPVPNPSEEMISSNNACISACPTGNGTEAENAAYASCQAGCIASFYYTASGTVAGATGTATDSADGSDSTGDSEDSEDATSTDSADGADSTTDTGAAGALGLPSAAIGLAAFLVAFAAL